MERETQLNLKSIQQMQLPAQPASLPHRFEGALEEEMEARMERYKTDDAWSTIMQWLYHRMEHIQREHP